MNQSPRTWRQSVWAAARIGMARLRFFLLLSLVLLIVGAWPILRNGWDTWTRPPAPDAAVSPDTEFWCPMCPGVVSDWPGKCPVCSMALVRRLKGEMTPLPDGALARVQFSPYRIQLAGIQTSPVQFRPLVREIIGGGLLEPGEARGEANPSRLNLLMEVWETDSGLLNIGQDAKVMADAFPGRVFSAHIKWMAPQLTAATRSLPVRLEIENVQRDLRPGMYAAARIPVLLAKTPFARALAMEAWRDRIACRLFAACLGSPFGPNPGSGLEALFDSAVKQAALERGLLPAVPESAVIDTGARKVVFREQSPGVFDGLEVKLGRRCGDFYPVLAGVEPGQAVVSAGAFLIDAETRLNPAAATAYFGAGGRSSRSSGTPIRKSSPAELSAEDQRLIDYQKVCPVTDELLGSMGAPVRVVVDGRTVFVCCEGCTATLKKNPGKYLAKLTSR